MDYNKEIYLGQMSIAVLITSMLILASVVMRGSQLSQVHFGKYVLNTFGFSFAASIIWDWIFIGGNIFFKGKAKSIGGIL